MERPGSMSDTVSAPESKSRWSAFTSIHAWMVLHFLLFASLCVVSIRWGPWTPILTAGNLHVSCNRPVSPDGSRLVGVNRYGGVAQVWNLDGVRLWKTISAPEEAIMSASFSPDGSAIVTTSEHGAGRKLTTVRLWDSVTGNLLRDLEKPKHAASMYVWEAYFSPDGGLVVARGPVRMGPRPSRVWDVSTGKWLFDFDGEADPRSFSAAGRRLAAARGDGTVGILDARTGGEIAAIKGPENNALSPAFSPDGRHVATTTREETEPAWLWKARVWDAETGEELFALPGSDQYAAMYSPGGRFIVTRDRGVSVAPFILTTKVSVWDSGTGERVSILDGYCPSVSFSADGTRVAGMSGGNRGSVWDLGTGRKLSSFPLVSDREFAILSVMRGDHGFYVHLSPTGDRMVVGCASASTVRVLQRRYPEGWTGHLYRVEVWVAIVIAAAWLWFLVRHVRERRRAAKEAATEGSAGANVPDPPRT
jgi:WD40 repeat protein